MTVTVYTKIVKQNRLCDNKRATFSNDEKAMEHVEKLMDNPNYIVSCYNRNPESNSHSLLLRRV